MITPNTGGVIESGSDSLSFWMQAPQGSIYDDSIQVLVSTTDTALASFTLIDYFKTDTSGGWKHYVYPLPSAANRYIAFRYLISDAGALGNQGDYVGLDAVEISSSGASSTFPLTVNVNGGWNMVSIPGLHPTNQLVLTWWPGKDPAASMFKYSGGYQAVDTLKTGFGYWLKNLGAQTYNTGDEWPAGGIQIVTHDPIAGAMGWNLIGGYENNAAVANITTTPSGLISATVFGYSGGYQPADTLKPGYGYWIKLSAAGQINMPSSALKGTSKIAELINKDWGKIVITDNAGRSYTLYAVEGEVNLEMFELPPAPPSGMFDVRYSSGRYAEDLNKSVQQIDLSGMVYPVKVKAEGIEIRVQDETGRIVNERLKSDEEVTISQNINKLNVSKDIIPDKYALEQNYPNPFNPSTVIEFSIPDNAKNVKLTIYNALGERVAELINGSFEPGVYRYQWDAVNFASGLYIYELRTEKFVSVKKMMLLK